MQAHSAQNADGPLSEGFRHLWSEPLLLTHLVSDLVIGVSFVVISLALATLVHRARRDIPFRVAFLAFGLLIATSGLAHLMAVVTLWTPVYWLSDGVRVIAALAAAATAAIMPFMVPRVHTTMRAARLAHARHVSDASAAALAEQNARLETLAADLERANAELRRVAAEAQRHLDELEATYRSAPVGLCVLDPDLRFVRINERLAAMNGHSAAAHVGRTVREIVPDIADQVEPVMRRVIATGEPVLSIEVHGETAAEPGAEHMWIEQWHPLRDPSGAVVGINVVAEDVTEHRRIDAARAASEARWRALVEAAPLIAWSSGQDGRVELANARWAAYAGEAADTFIGRHWSDTVHPDDQERVRERREHAIATGEAIELEVRFRRGDGEYRWHQVRVVPVASGGEVFAWHGGAVDVDDRRQEAEELRRANARLERVSEELRLANEELATASAEAGAARVMAEQASAAKSAFLATVSHELRTPLNAVLGYVELLAMGIVGQVTDAQRGYLDRVTASARHLLGLINEVLDLTKVEAGEMRVDVRPTSVLSEARDALTLVRPQASAKKLDLRIEGEAGGALVAAADPGRLRQILVNLLGNAVRFTDAGGSVVLRAALVERAAGGIPPTLHGDGPWVRIDVTDSGIGIPAHRLEAIFDPFVQVAAGGDSVYTRQHGGTGLGLTIARRLARLMGGDLTAESAEGQGSTFAVWLPASLAPLTAARAGGGMGGTSATRAARAEVGRVLVEQASAIVSAYTARLRTDPLIPAAADAAQIDLEDHIAAFLADLGQELTILDASDGDRLQLLADGSALQRLLVDRHGRQRRRIGWDETALRREFTLLLEEVERTVLHEGCATPEAPLADLLSLVRAFVDEAARVAVAAFQRGE